jgi:hypothetical protein
VTSGYSGTPLAGKLGIGPGHTVGIFDAPVHLAEILAPMPPGVEMLNEPDEPCDISLLFVTSRTILEQRLPAALRAMPADGATWIGWPKRSSGVATDLTEQTLRDVLLPLGLVDNKVCAIDSTWSGLRFVVRKENRARWAHGRP